MKDWKRVLWNWRARGRMGLTIHALATICQRPPQDIIREIKRSPANQITLSHCYAIKGPVFHFNPYNDQGRFRSSKVWQEVYETLRRWPWPEFKGIMHGVGCKTMTLRTPKSLLREP